MNPSNLLPFIYPLCAGSNFFSLLLIFDWCQAQRTHTHLFKNM